MNIKKIEIAWCVVADWEKAKEFYNKTLGLELDPDRCDDEMGWMEFTASHGNFVFGVSKESDLWAKPLKAGKNSIVVMVVDNLERSRTELQAKGVEFVGSEIPLPGGSKLQFFKDFDGNFFQLAEYHAE